MHAKHTPGPWQCHDGISVYQHRVSTHRLSPAICDVFRSGDARLIAAAPDLLEALRGVVALSDRKHEAWDAAKAAISKATGYEF
jgi:hypothetical protein